MISHGCYAIGLTGGICTGKSACEKYLKDFFTVLDADKIVHDLYANDLLLIESIEDVFGSKVVEKGVVNRKMLGQIVFSNPQKLNELVSLVHPKVTQVIQQKIQECKTKQEVTIFSIPLLFENSWQNYLDETIVVTCDPEIQIDRIQKRDNKTKEEALKVIQTQMPQQEKVDLANFVIKNDKQLKDLHLKLKGLFLQIS
ncbi:MAG: dephospho-CoA kinase [Candidatus Cloacimonetes bacterium]|nr:dephospho-CoA kinase [Candidatus Cloacimonadota bacterium]